MPPVPSERFARLFHGLDPTERAAFVAALWANRGWETTTDGKTVVATRESEEKRILVVDPGRFGTPALDDTDVLVAARDRDAVRVAAKEAGLRYLAPADVRELLLYGLERSTAAALFERTFGQPLEQAGDHAPTPREQVRAAGASLASSVSTHTSRRHLVALLVVGLLVGAAVGSPVLVSQRDSVVIEPIGPITPGDVGAIGERTATQTATVTATPTSDDYPAGLSENSLVDSEALADAHVQAVVGASRTLEIEASGPREAPLLGGREAFNTTARIEHSHHFRFDGRYRFPGENGSESRTVGVSLYAYGDTKFRQVRGSNGTSYQRYPIRTTGDARGYAVEVREYLVLLLEGDDSSVECVATHSGEDDCFAYRVVVTDAPAAVHAEVRNYRAVAIVQENGIVTSLAVDYTIPVGGGRVPVTYRMEYDDIGNTTVSAPDWLATAKNETSD